jgi:arginase
MAVSTFLVPYHLDRLRLGTGAGPDAIAAAGGLSRFAAPRTIISAAAGNEVQTCIAIDAALAAEARLAREAGDTLVVLSGNCHACLGTLGATGNDVSIIWFDAHGDLNTPQTTGSGFFDGMALATALGWAWRGLTTRIGGFAPIDEGHVLLVGGRDLDAGEREHLVRSRVRHFQPPALASSAETYETFDATLATVASPRAAYVHLDLDVLDPTELAANEYAVPGGVSIAWLEAALQAVSRRHDIVAIGVTSYDPAYHDADAVAAVVKRLLDAAGIDTPPVA